MKNLLKTLAGIMPIRFQRALKGAYFARQIGRGDFCADEPEFFLLDEWVADGDWVIDVGANVGHYTLKLSNLCGPNGRVFAFEPVPETFCLLSQNVVHFAYSNVTLFNAAASDSLRPVELSVPRFATGLSNYYMASISEAGEREDDASVSAVSVKIDVFDFPTRVSLVKIDAEGHELAVVNGLKRTIEKHKPVLIIEGQDPDVQEILVALGYRVKEYQDSPNRVYAPY